jgi:hypothetical protein
MTSGSREESMQDSGAGSHRQDTGRVGQMGDDRQSGHDSGAMRGSSSGTTGFGGERRQNSVGSPGGVEGVDNKTGSTPDEDRSRNR